MLNNELHKEIAIEQCKNIFNHTLLGSGSYNIFVMNVIKTYTKLKVMSMFFNSKNTLYDQKFRI